MEEHDGLIAGALDTMRDRDIRKQLKMRLPRADGEKVQQVVVDEVGESKREVEKVLMWMASGPSELTVFLLAFIAFFCLSETWGNFFID